MRRGILATRDELGALAERLDRRPFDMIYETLNRRCSLILDVAPITEAQWRSLWQQGVWGAAVQAARTTQGRIIDLLVAHHIDSNSAYRARAIEELKNLISWTTWVDPCHNHVPADLCTAEAAVGAVVGLDWLWEDLSRPDRLRIIKAIKSKAIDPYRQGVQQQVFWYNAYHNWNAILNGGIGLAALALGDDEPAADEALGWARDGLGRFFEALGREGGWDEGTGYWAYGMRYLLLFGEGLSRQLEDQSILHKRGLDVTGQFPVYFTPNGHAASFGDNPSVPLLGSLYLLVKHFGVNELTWWLDNYSLRRDVSTSGWSAAGLAMLFRPADAETPKTPDLAALKTYHEIGWTAMADRWPRPTMYVAGKTGDMSANHSHHDMNSIQVQVDGEMLLTDPGHPPYTQQYFTDERGEFYEVQAQAHNTIVVGENDHLLDVQGSIVEGQCDKAYRWVALDSAGALGDDVHFVRHVVMVINPESGEGETLVVFDELDSGGPERVELFWHTLGSIDLDARKMTGVISGRRASLGFALASTAKASIGTKAHKLDTRRTDTTLRLSCGVVGRAYFASVFARQESDAELTLTEDHEGVQVTFGGLAVSFKPDKHRLKLDVVQRS